MIEGQESFQCRGDRFDKGLCISGQGCHGDSLRKRQELSPSRICTGIALTCRFA
jgi:hypothetical protein